MQYAISTHVQMDASAVVNKTAAELVAFVAECGDYMTEKRAAELIAFVKENEAAEAARLAAEAESKAGRKHNRKTASK